MVHTWVMDVTPLLEEETYAGYYQKLPLWRRKKADKLRFREAKALSAGVWILYQRMQGEYGILEDAVYNLSHSGKYALCSVEDGGGAAQGEDEVRLGCDVEMIGKLNIGMIKRFFCPEEAAYILGQKSEKLQTEAFFRYWVLKESFMKATREGLRLELDSFELRIEGDSPRLVRQPEAYPEQYYYKEYTLEADDARIAVCSTDCSFGRLRILAP